MKKSILALVMVTMSLCCASDYIGSNQKISQVYLKAAQKKTKKRLGQVKHDNSLPHKERASFYAQGPVVHVLATQIIVGNNPTAMNDKIVQPWPNNMPQQNFQRNQKFPKKKNYNIQQSRSGY